jgi:uncharacterized membrane protein YfcA
MDYVTLSIIGLVMGCFGGLLGIGGSTIMIPAMLMAFGPNQHLYQAAAMLCNFFVAFSAVLAHKKANALVAPALKKMIPTAVVGIIIGVTLSNLPVFAGDKSYLLSRCFGGFLIYVAIYNCFKFRVQEVGILTQERYEGADGFASLCVGGASGVGAGLLGIGAGTISTPFQQLLMKMPLRNAMSNSAAMIMSVALVGGVYKTVTLGQHGVEPIEAIKIAGIIVPTALVGGYAGGHLMHRLPVNVVRAIFVALLIVASCKMLMTGPN